MYGRAISGLFFLSLPLIGQHGSTDVVNPFKGPEHAAAGAKLFRGQCAGCHGANGGGAGAGPSLTSGTPRHGSSDEALFQTISKGVPGTSMPGFAFSGMQIWQLVTHLRTLAIAHGETQAKGDAQAGAALFQSVCSNCHSVAGAGGLAGPDLTTIGARRSSLEIRKALSEPDADVPSEYWSVSIRTSAGRKLRGTRLNEDTHSMQIRDDAGRLVSVLKRDIVQSELIRRSPMPSFAAKFSESEWNDLLAYLTGLRAQ